MARRPIAVWITQIILAIMTAVLAYDVFYVAAAMARPEINRAIAAWGINALGRGIFFLGFMGTTFWGLQKAKNYGRWLGVVFVALSWGGQLYGALHPVQGPIPTFSINFSNPGELGGFVLAALIAVGFLILGVELAFGKSSKKFFGSVALPPDSGTAE